MSNVLKYQREERLTKTFNRHSNLKSIYSEHDLIIDSAKIFCPDLVHNRILQFASLRKEFSSGFFSTHQSLEIESKIRVLFPALTKDAWHSLKDGQLDIYSFSTEVATACEIIEFISGQPIEYWAAQNQLKDIVEIIQDSLNECQLEGTLTTSMALFSNDIEELKGWLALQLPSLPNLVLVQPEV